MNQAPNAAEGLERQGPDTPVPPTVLIANRGEIARRVIRTARALGWRTVALVTAPDAGALHAREADDVVSVPSYLAIDAIVAAARSTGAGFVHPGYGFLSERAEFARALESAQITLLGPSAAVMEAMGRKDHAREVAIRAGVPVVPSWDVNQDPHAFEYPVVVKAAAGGGGKGMRVVQSADDFAEALAAAQREAAKSFGDDTMLVEKYVASGRHIEVQVVGDTHGTVRHFFERDCSSQRRHQKVLEEAPAPTLSNAQRIAVTTAGVALAAQVGYVGAGTIEFLLDNSTGDFYFLEMNTRLQVEHPVTEQAVGLNGGPLDLVALQLRVGLGEPLGFAQTAVELIGCAIEARVYAEDAWGGFLPQAGRASSVEWPAASVVDGVGVRVDEALASGQVIGTDFDPMLGKVIGYAPDREAARQKLVEALQNTRIWGLTTNTGFLRDLVASAEFAEATLDTAWLDHHHLPAPPQELAKVLAARALAEPAVSVGSGSDPWRHDGFRTAGPPAPLQVFLADEQMSVDVSRGARVFQDPYRTNVRLVESGGRWEQVWVRARSVETIIDGHRFVFARLDPWAESVGAVTDGTVSAPMPGILIQVRVEPGQQVSAGETLGVLEAMKMEVPLVAPVAGTLTRVEALAGAHVALGAVLFEVSAVGTAQSGA